MENLKYVEITKEAFFSIVPDDAVCEKVVELEHARKIYTKEKGVVLLEIINFLGRSLPQYYIADINS